MAMSGNAYSPEERSGMSMVSLNASHHISDENYRRTPNKEGERTLVCLDANERRLSFFINGSLKHLVRDVPIPGKVVVGQSLKVILVLWFLEVALNLPLDPIKVE